MQYGIGLIGRSSRTLTAKELATQMGVPAVFFDSTKAIPALPAYVLSHPRERTLLPQGARTLDIPADDLFSRGERTAHAITLPSGDARGVVRCRPEKFAAALSLFGMEVQKALKHAGLPLLTLSPFPHGAKSLLSFRVDADWYDANEWKKTADLLSPLGASVSFFVTCADIPPAGWNFLSTLSKQGIEIGSHGFRHYTFVDRKNTEKNLERARSALSSHGLPPRAFASPSAKWNLALQDVIDAGGYTYSSEFCLAHDTYPFHAVLFGKSAGALQVPVHPVAPSSFLRRGITDSAVIREYYASIADALLRANLPLFFYGHPNDLAACPWLPAFLKELMTKEGVRPCSLGEYAAWWTLREKSLNAPWEISGGNVQKPEVDSSIRFREYASHETLPFASYEGPSLRRLPPPRSLRYRIGTWLDYERIVPSAEYAVSSAKTLLNYLVKKMRGL